MFVSYRIDGSAITVVFCDERQRLVDMHLHFSNNLARKTGMTSLWTLIVPKFQENGIVGKTP